MNNLNIKCHNCGFRRLKVTKYRFAAEVYDSYEEALEEALNYIDEAELVPLWNEYCYAINDFESVIREMVNFDDYCCDFSPSDIVKNLSDEFNIHDEYFIDGVYGFESFNYPSMNIDFFELACWLADQKDVYDCSAFSEIEEVDDSDKN